MPSIPGGMGEDGETKQAALMMGQNNTDETDSKAAIGDNQDALGTVGTPQEGNSCGHTEGATPMRARESHNEGPLSRAHEKLIPVSRKGGPGMFTGVWKYVAVLTFAAGSFSCLRAQDVVVPTVNARLGPCSVDFTVTDHVHRPLYGATIHAKFKYGFWGFRSMDLMIYTNSSGHARVAGLPAKLRNPPLPFAITYRNVEQTWYWTGLRCHEQPTIVLDTR